MRRRELLLGALGIAAAWPLEVAAQKRAPFRIAYLSVSSAETDLPLLAEFRAGMRALGHGDGASYVLELRFATGEEAPAAARDLATREPDLFLVYSAQAALAAAAVAPRVPIVAANVVDPVLAGLAASLKQPGGMFTGISDSHSDSVTKRLELLKEAVPGAAVIGVLHNPENASNPVQLKDLEAAAPQLDLRLVPVAARTPGEVEQAFAAFARERVSAVQIIGDSLFTGRQDAIAMLALRHRLATIYTPRRFAASGGLMAYGADFDAMFRRAAFFVDRIMKGAHPGDLPIEQPTRFLLVVNQRTAHSLGLALSPAFLSRADEVIE